MQLVNQIKISQMKRLFIVGAIALFIPIIIMIGFEVFNQPILKKVHTEDMPPLIGSSNLIQIVLVDSVDGRPTYNVIFPDGNVLDSMYPEEIANGLVTGKWDYNEDLTIK